MVECDTALCILLGNIIVEASSHVTSKMYEKFLTQLNCGRRRPNAKGFVSLPHLLNFLRASIISEGTWPNVGRLGTFPPTLLFICSLQLNASCSIVSRLGGLSCISVSSVAFKSSDKANFHQCPHVFKFIQGVVV